MRARKALRVKNLTVLKYLLRGKTNVFPTPFLLWSSQTENIENKIVTFVLQERSSVEGGCELQSENL